MRMGSAPTPTDGDDAGGGDAAVVTAILEALRPRSLPLPPSALVPPQSLPRAGAASGRVATETAAAATNDHVRAAAGKASRDAETTAPPPLPPRAASRACPAR